MSTEGPTFAQTLRQLDSAERRLCVGIDPHPEVLLHWGLRDDAAGSEEFSSRIIEAAVESGVALIKPQVALFERHGLAGMRVLAQIIGRMRTLGIRVIADAKRGDIGTSLQGYAAAWLTPGGDFESDALTLSPYLGVGALKPACDLALEHGKGVFVLAATSNPDGQRLQSATTPHGVSVAQEILEELQETVAQHQAARSAGETGRWGAVVGAVVGATVNHEALGVDLSRAADVVVLAPGFGHQGATLRDLSDLFGPATPRVIPTVSRSVAGHDPDGVLQRLANHLEELRRVGS